MSSQTLLLAVIVALLGVIVLQQLIHNYQTMRWTRSFLDKQGVPQHIMDGEPAPTVVPSKPVVRPRITIPIPGAPALNWRKPK